MKLQKLVSFFTIKAEEHEFEIYWRSRILNSIVWVLILIAPFYSFNFYLKNSPISAISILIGIPICIGSLLILKRSDRTFLVTNIILATLLTVVIIQTFNTGGFLSSIIIWVVILPLIATVSAGKNAGLIWGCTSLLSLFVIYFLDIYGFRLKNDFAGLQLNSIWLVELLGVSVVVFVFSIVTESTGLISSQIVKKHHRRLQLITSALNVSSEGIHVVNTKMEHLFQNRKFLEMFGFDESDTVEKEILAALFPDEETARNILLTIYKGKTWSGELLMRKKDGSRFPAFLRVDGLINDSGRAYALIGIYSDITEQKEMMRALQENEEKYRMIAENTSDVIWIRNMDLSMKYISPSVEKLRGCKKEEMNAIPIEETMTPESYAIVVKTLKEAIENYDELIDVEKTMELEMVKKGGETFWCEISIRFLKDSAGQPIGIIGTTRNIDDRKKAEDELKAVKSELINNALRAGMADVASGVLHNIGNILNSVKTSAHVAKSTLDNSSLAFLSQANQMLKDNQNNLADFLGKDQNGEKLVDYYLKLEKALIHEHEDLANDIARIDKKVGNIADVIISQQRYAGFGGLTEKIDLESLVQDVLEIESESIRSAKVTIEKQFDSIPPINTQKIKLLHILVNLVKNAVEAMANTPPDKRLLRILIKSDSENVIIIVQDSGMGIKSKDLQKIFTHGYSQKSDGHGFGLHTSAIYMEELGGKMWVESEGLNQGASFILQLPLDTEMN